MMTNSAPDRLSAVFEAVDAANARDPKIAMVDGAPVPAALIYGQRMTTVLAGFEPNASEALQVAVRGQHIERFLRPRAAYPEGRIGYLQWRKAAAEFHGSRISDIMQAAGYDTETAARASVIARKVGIKSDPETQTLEDVACLVFMRWYFAPFAQTRSADELYSIVEKTAKKMSAKGRAAALQLPLPPHLVPAITSAGESAA